MKKSMAEFFEKIYQEKIFVNKYKEPISLSGPGSFPENVVDYLLFLKEFIEKNNIKSVVDYGCGDFVLYKNFSWSNINYLGIDVSETAINIAKKNENENIKFLHKETIDLPKADLLIVKDVFGHWLPGNSVTVFSKDLGDKSSVITEFLNINYDNFKFIIIVDGLNYVKVEENDIKKYFPIKCEFLEKEISFIKRNKKIYIKKYYENINNNII